jgi:ribosome-associated toxin RatA of RatAB toxin-antitoxin module
MNKLNKLHNEFEAVTLDIERHEIVLESLIDKGFSTINLEGKIENLEDKQFNIQCKIEYLEYSKGGK